MHIDLIYIMSSLFFISLFIFIFIMYYPVACKRPSGHFKTIPTPHAVTPLRGLMMHGAIKPSGSVLY